MSAAQPFSFLQNTADNQIYGQDHLRYCIFCIIHETDASACYDGCCCMYSFDHRYGYTSVLKTGVRKGDNAPTALITWVK